MANTVTPTTVKNNARALAFKTLCLILGETYGTDYVYQIGDSEVAVRIDKAPTGEPIYAVFSPVVKDYCDRTTKTKTIKAFDLTEAVNAYNATLDKRAKEAEEAAERKAKKVAEDKAKREANAKAKAEHAKAKADALTEFKNRWQKIPNAKVEP